MPSIFVQTFAAQPFKSLARHFFTFKLQMKLTFITSNLCISIYVIRYKKFSQMRSCCR